MVGIEAFAHITMDAAYYEENAKSVDLWPQGNPLFKAPELMVEKEAPPPGTTLRDLLNG